MLISKGFSSGDIVILKLVNGDEIIARLEEESKEEVKFSRPKAVTFNGQGLGMIPWVFLGEAEIYTLSKTHVFTIVPARKDAASQYMEGTTGIALR
jgi:hypothetical protein